MTWVADYVGLPYEDQGRCWGLVATIQEKVFGRTVPRYEEHLQTEDRHEIARLMASESRAWDPVEAGTEQEGDIIQLRRGGTPCHVGTVVRPGWMIHADKGLDAVVESYAGMRWRSRVVGFWRGYNGPGDA